MAEGGIFPWKLEKSTESVPYTNYNSLGEPISDPPCGEKWSRSENGDFIIIDSKETEPEVPTVQAKTADSNFVDHVIMPSDTLEGLCLRYDVSAKELRRINQFSGNQFQACGVLRIPINGAHIVYPQDDSSPEILCQKLILECGLSKTECMFYLEEHNFNYNEARNACRSDVAWEKTDKSELRELAAVEQSVHGPDRLVEMVVQEV